MKKMNFNLNFDSKSKIIDLLIVIIGISIAFKLNTWNESRKTDLKAKNYIKNFYEENTANETNLVSALKFVEASKKENDTLKQILLSRNYTDNRIKKLTLKMITTVSCNPSVTTMENIKASGDFELIKDIELRKKIISAYKSYQTSLKFEEILTTYIDVYVTPFLYKNVRFSDKIPINSNLIKQPLFENIICGYEALLNQQINGYQDNLDKIEQLNTSLYTANKAHVK